MLGVVALAASAAGAATRSAAYTVAGTRACISRQADSVAGMPPATPPSAAALFFAAFGPGQQLGAWAGTPAQGYHGISLDFYASTAAAQKAFASSGGNKRLGNVVARWVQKTPSRSMQKAVIGCLRSGSPKPVTRRAPAASLATFGGLWGGHTRGLSLTAKGGAGESANDGCCTRLYQLAFQIRSVTGTLTHATAVFRVTSYKAYPGWNKQIHVGETGKLSLRNGIVTDSLTSVFFCSDPAWGATGACGA